MGLKFCNEAIIALKQIWPVPEDSQEDLSSLQVGLAKYYMFVLNYNMMNISCSRTTGGTRNACNIKECEYYRIIRKVHM